MVEGRLWARALIGMFLVVSFAQVACQKDEPCQVTLGGANQEATGTGKTKAAALEQACLMHCIQYDSLLDGKYRVWKAAGGQSSGDRAKDIAAVPPLTRFRNECQKRCLSKPPNPQYQHCVD